MSTHKLFVASKAEAEEALEKLCEIEFTTRNDGLQHIKVNFLSGKGWLMAPKGGKYAKIFCDGCTFHVVMRKHQKLGKFHWKVVKEESNLHHISRIVVDGENFQSSCESKGKVSTVRNLVCGMHCSFMSYSYKFLHYRKIFWKTHNIWH